MSIFDFITLVQKLRASQKNYEKIKPYYKAEKLAAKKEKEKLEAEVDKACKDYDNTLLSNLQGELF